MYTLENSNGAPLYLHCVWDLFIDTVVLLFWIHTKGGLLNNLRLTNVHREVEDVVGQEEDRRLFVSRPLGHLKKPCTCLANDAT